jgi:hypothetical protein
MYKQNILINSFRSGKPSRFADSFSKYWSFWGDFLQPFPWCWMSIKFCFINNAKGFFHSTIFYHHFLGTLRLEVDPKRKAPFLNVKFLFSTQYSLFPEKNSKLLLPSVYSDKFVRGLDIQIYTRCT